MTYILKSYFVIVLFIFHININADSFQFNTYNNHGIVGLINMPTARFYDESAHGITIYDGTPDQKITLTSNPYSWLEASFFYTNIQGKPYCLNFSVEFCTQDYKDKGFNLKLKVKEQGNFPAIAVGLMDFAGTGFYGSEYIVTSYAINNIDIHYGIGWGALTGQDDSITNPLGYINDNFKTRPVNTKSRGGSFQPSRYFSGETASIFHGASYALNEKILVKVEKDNTRTNGRMPYDIPNNDYSLGIEYSINKNLVLGLSYERGNFASLKFIYKNNPKTSHKKYKYKGEVNNDGNKYKNLITNLERNGVGVNRVIEKANSIGLELTQFTHPNLQLVEEIIQRASKDAGIKKEIKKNLKTVNLSAVTEFDSSFEENSKLIYVRERKRKFNTSTSIKFRPFIASREEFFKGALLAENDSEYIFFDNLIFHSNLKYSLVNNFKDFKYGPEDTFPAQVRSDVKQYLKNIDNGILIGRAQLDYFISPYKNHHLMLTGGILEDMFSGYGFEYLYFKQNLNYSIGFEAFNVKKRDYDWGFGSLDYETTTAHINLNYRNYGLIPFDMKLSYGRYLAGDIGTSIEFSRTYENGVNFGVFASFTDVTDEQFGEGSFDKGLFFNIPIYGNLINYSWRPLTKDPGAKLIRKNTLHGLLVKFRDIN
jgi:hypothetical protein